MRQRYIRFIQFSVVAFMLAAVSASAATDVAIQDKFYRAEIIKIAQDGMNEVAGEMSPFQIVKVKFLNGPQEGEEAIVEHGTKFTLDALQKVAIGEKVIVSTNDEGIYAITDTDRLNPLILIFAIFFAAAVIFGSLKGFTSILGMLFSVVMVVGFVIPSIIKGSNPLLVSLAAAFVIAVVSIYLAHGFNRRSTVSLLSMSVTLILSAVLAALFVSLAKLHGLGAEEAIYLQWGPLANLNFKGLLLGGIIIGALGVLDDVTTAQVAVVYELKDANPAFSFKDLYKRAISVGHEHIAALVNTLVLAYAGASLPALILFSGDSDIPIWVLFNSEFIAEEVIRTLVGSTTLVLAVPISTFLAAWFCSRRIQLRR